MSGDEQSGCYVPGGVIWQIECAIEAIRDEFTVGRNDPAKNLVAARDAIEILAGRVKEMLEYGDYDGWCGQNFGQEAVRSALSMVMGEGK